MRENISFNVSAADRRRLEQLISGRNTPAKVVWRAKIILATADGLGTMAIMRASGKSKPCVTVGALISMAFTYLCCRQFVFSAVAKPGPDASHHPDEAY